MLNLALTAMLFLPASPVLPLAQDETPEIVDKRPEIKELVETLEDHIGKRGDEDPQAIEVIDRLYQEFPNCGKKDRGSIVDVLDDCFKVKRRESDEGVRDNALYLAAAVTLRDMGPESAPVLMSWIGHKTHRKDIVLQEKLILSLGKTKDEKGLKLLIKTLDDKTPAIQAATAEALGEWEGEDQDLRKDTFDELKNLLLGVKGAVDSDPNDTISRDRYDAISAPIITSLQRLSGQKINDPNEWLRWWNKNKKADWDEPNG